MSHPEDSPQYLFEDIIRVGAYLNEQNLVERLTEEAPARAAELIEWGAKVIALGASGATAEVSPSGPSFPRAHYIPGVSYMTALRNRLAALANATVREDTIATKLLTEGRQGSRRRGPRHTERRKLRGQRKGGRSRFGRPR